MAQSPLASACFAPSSYAHGQLRRSRGALPIYQDVRDWTYGLSTYDATHVLVANYTWLLPKMSALVDKPVVRAIFDNWQLSGISTFASGNPANITFTTVDNTDLLGGGDSPTQIVQTGNPNLPKGDRSFTHAVRRGDADADVTIFINHHARWRKNLCSQLYSLVSCVMYMLARTVCFST